MNTRQKMIDRALRHIRSQQSPDGGFVHLSSDVINDFSGAISRKTTFFTANILACLQNIPENSADIKNASAQFLLTNKSERWSFNYWPRDATRGNGAIPYPPYPDDLDDTFAALTAIVRHDPAIIDGRAYAAIANMLTALEIQPGGPYRTWLVGNDAPAQWQDIDIVVNSTIGYFLSLIGIRLPSLKHFIDTAIQEHHLVSPYYPDMIHVGYFISRFYKDGIGKTAKTLEHLIGARFLERNGEGMTDLQIAMAITTLANVGCSEKIVEAMMDALLIRLEYKGFLPYAFCIDPGRNGKRCYAGASALTAAFCAEALACGVAVPAVRTRINTMLTPSPCDHIRALAQVKCRDVGLELSQIAIASINKNSDKRIIMLAYDYAEALYKNGIVVPCEIIETLSLANLYGWMAYDIYDDAFDGEGDPSLIPCANFFLRLLTELYNSLGARIPAAKNLFGAMMNLVDNANAWEQTHCRIGREHNNGRSFTTCIVPSFGNYETLADRSIGHAMGPLAVLLFLGYETDSEEYKNTELFFRHYLIARQLHDDAHDWADDFVRGRINSVGAIVLTKSQTQPLTVLKKIFWEEVIDGVADMITSHIDEARRIRQLSPILAGSDFMESELRTLAGGARRAIKERDDSLAFLKEYKGYRASGAQF